MFTLQRMRTTFRLITWLCLVGFLVAWTSMENPELRNYWKGLGIAFLLTAISFGGAILLSGQYKQRGK